MVQKKIEILTILTVLLIKNIVQSKTIHLLTLKLCKNNKRWRRKFSFLIQPYKKKIWKCIKSLMTSFSKKITSQPNSPYIYTIWGKTHLEDFPKHSQTSTRRENQRQLRDDLKIDFNLVNIPYISTTDFLARKKIVARARTQMYCEQKCSVCFLLFFSVAVRRRQNNVDHIRRHRK